MSVEQFSSMIKKHIIATLSEKKTNPLEGIDSAKIRSTLEKGKSHTAVMTKASLDALKNQFKDPNSKFKLPNTNKFVAAKDVGPILDEAIKVFESINFDDFADWLVSKRGKAATESTGKGINTKILQASIKGGDEERSGGQIAYFKSSTDKASVFLKNVPQKTLRELLGLYLFATTTKNTNVVEFIKFNLEAGHLAGVFSLRIKNLFGAQYSNGKFNLPIDEADKKLSDQVSGILRLLLDADYLTGNLPNHHKLFVKAEKEMFSDNPHAVTELQLSSINQQAGRSMVGLGVVLSNIEKAVSKGGYGLENSIKSLLNALGPAIQDIRNAHKAITVSDASSRAAINKALTNADFIDDLINKPSSPTFKDSISDNIANIILKGKKLPKAKIVRTKTDIIKSELVPSLQDSVKRAVELTSKINKALIVKKDSVPDKIVKSKGAKSAKVKIAQFTSLASLQTLLNQALTQQIKKNMKKPALQNRTGRFAESVQVERLSESRAGMITAFYSYMKSPYQTFEPGFRQGTEARNPKTLISKSIREVAAGIVGNRLRAVRL